MNELLFVELAFKLGELKRSGLPPEALKEAAKRIFLEHKQAKKLQSISHKRFLYTT